MKPDPFTAANRRRWKERIEWMRDEHPADKPIRVMRTSRLSTGDCADCGTHYQIRIARQPDSFTMSVHLLLHEWAHALEPEGDDHSPAFWHALGVLYNADETYCQED